MAGCPTIARICIVVSLALGCGRTPGAVASSRQADTRISGLVPPLPVGQAVVTSSRGLVELQRGPAGQWSAVRVGDKLGASDALRTGKGEADLAVEGVRMRLQESSGVQLRAVGERSVRARIHGSVESEVEQGRGRLDVEVEGSDAVAHSDGGHFYVTADGRGVVAVAAVTGTVHVTSAGKSVDVKKGEISRVMAASTPNAPVEALRRVLLSVEWPQQRETKLSRLPISGRVEAGSRVFVQGQAVEVEPGGGFRANVPLRQGKQRIAVLTVDALGRRKVAESVVRRDDSLPDVRVKKKLWQWH